MKNTLLTIAAVLLFAVAVSAQVSSPVSLYVGGALSLPQSPESFSETFKTGFHGSVGVGYKVMPSLQVVGKLEYHRFAVDFENTELAAENISGGHNNVLMYGADARYGLSVPAFPLKPFLLGGVGFARLSATEFDGSSDLVASLNDSQAESQTKFYYNVGAGIELSSGPLFGLFAQARYVSVSTDNESSSFIPITLGLKFF
jgi:opacity protein-like surface antigen